MLYADYFYRYRRIQDIKAQQYKNNQHKAQQFISNQTSSELSNNQNRTKYATESYHYMQPLIFIELSSNWLDE